MNYLAVKEISYNEGIGYGYITLEVDGIKALQALTTDNGPSLDTCGEPITSFQGSVTFDIIDTSPGGYSSLFTFSVQIGESNG